VELPGVVTERRPVQVPPHVDLPAGQTPFGHERVGSLKVGGGDPMRRRGPDEPVRGAETAGEAHQPATPARRSLARVFRNATGSAVGWTRTWVVPSGERSIAPLRVGTARHPAAVAAAISRAAPVWSWLNGRPPCAYGG